MNIDRLNILADFLERVPEDKLDFNSWQDPGYHPMDGDYSVYLHTCGTTACAAGWALAIPAFNAAGLHADVIGSPKYNSHTGFWALREFFDLRPPQDNKIFGCHIQATPKEHAMTIRRMIAEEIRNAKEPEAASEGVHTTACAGHPQ